MAKDKIGRDLCGTACSECAALLVFASIAESGPFKFECDSEALVFVLSGAPPSRPPRRKSKHENGRESIAIVMTPGFMFTMQ